MTVLKLMAAALDLELQDRGIYGIGRFECEAIMTAVVARTAAMAESKPQPAVAETPKRQKPDRK